MRKYFCDSCKKEVDRPNVFEVPYHLFSKRGECGYVDNELNAVSGKKDCLDLCNGCLNKAYSSAIAALGV